MIEIGQNKYEHDLLSLFWTYKPTGEKDQKMYALLNRVCHAWVIKRDNDSLYETISGINLNDEEQNLVREYQLIDHPNLEVRTRFSDVMVRFGKGKEKLELMRKASDGYLELCKVTGTYLFFCAFYRNKTSQDAIRRTVHADAERRGNQYKDSSWMANQST